MRGLLAGGLFLVVAALAAGPLPVGAEETAFTLTIREHRFEPAELTVPAGKRVKLIVHNADATPEEFESHDLQREKIIPGGKKATIWIGPLKPGTYTFVGEFHEDTAKGKIHAK